MTMVRVRMNENQLTNCPSGKLTVTILSHEKAQFEWNKTAANISQ